MIHFTARLLYFRKKPNGIHHHPGILFGFTMDWRSES
jgi:hypothetical protein